MKKLSMGVLILFSSPSMVNAKESGFSIKGSVQATMESQEGSNGVSNGTTWGRGPKFSTASSRLAVKGSMKRMFGGLQVELADGVDNNFSFKDGYAGYKLSKVTTIQTGRFKVPIGIDHLTSNVELDLVEESVLTGHLTHGRKNGLMLVGDLIGNLSYNIAYFTTSNDDIKGNDHAYAARLTYDRGNLHLETAFAAQENNEYLNGTPPVTIRSHRDFSTMALGASYEMKKWILKGEYILGTNVVLPNPRISAGTTSDFFDMGTVYAHLGYRPSNKLEFLVRHYISNVTSSQSGLLDYNSTISNTYLGVNILPEKNFVFQLNYILVGGDGRTTASSATGGAFPEITGGRTANTFVALALLMF